MIISKVPFRISLGGGGTDLPSYYENYGGYVLSAAINKYMYVFINIPDTCDKTKLYYAKVEVVEDVDNIEHDIIRESLKYFKIDTPLEISSMADIESGTGMGSSSSFTVALIAGLNLLQRKMISPSILAEEACCIEIEKVQKKIGKQDQYIASHGGVQELLFAKDRKVTVNPLPLSKEFVSELESRMLLFYTGIRRPAALILDNQSDLLKKKQKKLVKIMHDIKAIGLEVKDALITEDIDRIGRLFFQHWELKSMISPEMETPEVHSWINEAYCHGSLGSKIIGAGGGGFILCVCADGHRKELLRHMVSLGLRYVDFRFEFEGVKIINI
jgi:D-glycero-alpha-D-manno-heptose-7-phosphate kinase